MKDNFGNAKPILIEIDEWWYNGRIIQKQTHPFLCPYISFASNEEFSVVKHFTFKEAKIFCLNNPCVNPKYFPSDYLSIDK